MDAKPQRPRALRIHDENAPMTRNGALPGKTLHQRTKSVPAFPNNTATAAAAATAAIANNTRKILGVANPNTKVKVKDDIEIGTASPGKLAMHDALKPVLPSALSRPALRPQAARAVVSATSTTAAATSAISKSTATTILPSNTTTKSSANMLPLRTVAAAPKEGTIKEVVQVPALAADSYKPRANEVSGNVPMSTIPTLDSQSEVRLYHSVNEPAIQPSVAPLATASTLYTDGYLQSHYYVAAEDPALAQLTIPGVYPEDSEPPLEHEGYVTAANQYDCATFGPTRYLGDSTHTFIMEPSYTDDVHRELAAAKAYVDIHRTPEEADDEMWDTSMVVEYGDEIFSYMRVKEMQLRPNPNYMSHQSELQWSMRGILLDWVVQVHQRFNLLPETLFLAVNFVDRFLSCKVISIGKLQLVGATALFIAAKYEEVTCPGIDEVIYMVDGGYTTEELLKAERFMLSMLQFELGWPGPMSFLRRISKADDYDLRTRTLAKYFLEVAMMDERFVAAPPSYLAAGAHCLARMIIHNKPWSTAHVYYSNYTFNQLKLLLKALWEGCVEPQRHHSAVYHKYNDRRYRSCASFVEEEMFKGFRLPFDISISGNEPGKYNPDDTALSNWASVPC